ncbi:MAG: NFYB/HAP3 family transcription factor subunit [Candidatus Marsarchaeota archaeon]|jgi:histone H3/H4
MGELPKAVVERMLKQESGMRVSSEAVNMASKLAEEVIRYIGREGGVLAKHAGRSTLMASDLKLASRRVNEAVDKLLQEQA